MRLKLSLFFFALWVFSVNSLAMNREQMELRKFKKILSKQDKTLLKENWEKITKEKQEVSVVMNFYKNLIENPDNSDIAQFFCNTPEHIIAEKLGRMVSVLLVGLEEPEEMLGHIKRVGVLHGALNIASSQYRRFARAFGMSVADSIYPNGTSEHAQAILRWKTFIGAVSKMMRDYQDGDTIGKKEELIDKKILTYDQHGIKIWDKKKQLIYEWNYVDINAFTPEDNTLYVQFKRNGMTESINLKRHDRLEDLHTRLSSILEMKETAQDIEINIQRIDSSISSEYGTSQSRN